MKFFESISLNMIILALGILMGAIITEGDIYKGVVKLEPKNGSTETYYCTKDNIETIKIKPRE